MHEKILYNNWLKYADSVGDFNPIHREKVEAEKFGLKNAIAPGMYILSFIQKSGRINYIEARFSGVVRDGDEIEIENEKNIFVREMPKPAVRITRISHDMPDNVEIKEPEVDCVYATEINDEKINNFLESIGMKADCGWLPEMYLVSLSAPALLKWGEEKKMIGMHAIQSAEIHHQYAPGKIEIGVKNVGKKLGLEDFLLYWVQNNRVVASGEAMIKPLYLLS